MKKKQYYEYPYCHAHLDFGERCDCEREKNRREMSLMNRIKIGDKGQYEIDFSELEHGYREKAVV